jgi:hypothetical protein
LVAAFAAVSEIFQEENRKSLVVRFEDSAWEALILTKVVAE